MQGTDIRHIGERPELMHGSTAMLKNSDAAMVALLLTFAYVDGELHPSEVEVLKRTCADLAVDPDLVSTVLREFRAPQGDLVSLCKQAMSKITDEDLQIKALVAFCDIAAADNVFEENERTFLSLATECWDITASEHGELEWDAHQQLVIEAPASDRLEIHAGPGMGKTAVACARVSKLIEAGVEPSNIWLLSFTRTAVQEIRDRIELFSNDSTSVLSVKIGTIDSRAWRIRCGFSDGEVEKLFGSYDASIRSVVGMIEQDPREIVEFLESLDHVIIDEAQDITSVRARLIGEMLKLLPEHCGVTIFADPAQAIYGWTTDGENIPEEDRVNLLEILRSDLAHSFTQHELQTIHRTDAPNLIELIEELRLDIYVNQRIDADTFKQRREIIVEKANARLDNFDAKELRQFQNALVLFRRRSEVLMASSFANSEKIQHRIRMSGLPTMVHPWLGQLLANYTDNTIDRDAFLTLWTYQGRRLLNADFDLDSAWNLIFDLGRRGSVVSVPEVRKKLARTPPEFRATLPDLGAAGPIISTIHASKGREADEVILRLPPEKKLTKEHSELDEESRVMFVGASRARRRLYVGSGFLRASFAPSLASGRTFLPTMRAGDSTLPSAQVEIGRDGDLDYYSFVSRFHHSQAGARKVQRQLATLATKAPIPVEAKWDPSNRFRYQLWTKYDGNDVGKPIGYFSETLNKQLFHVRDRISRFPRALRPPERLQHLYLIGVSTFAADENDVRLQDVHEPFSSTGIWTIPIIVGFPKINFHRKKAWRTETR